MWIALLWRKSADVKVLALKLLAAVLPFARLPARKSGAEKGSNPRICLSLSLLNFLSSWYAIFVVLTEVAFLLALTVVLLPSVSS